MKNSIEKYIKQNIKTLPSIFEDVEITKIQEMVKDKVYTKHVYSKRYNSEIQVSKFHKPIVRII